MSITAVPHLVTVLPTGPCTVNLARLHPHVSIFSMENKDATAPASTTRARAEARYPLQGQGTAGSRQASQARSIPGSPGKGIAQIPGATMVLQWAPPNHECSDQAVRGQTSPRRAS